MVDESIDHSETGFELPFALWEEFTNQFPNVNWDIKQDQFTNLVNSTPRLLLGENAPDLIRLRRWCRS